MDHIFQQKMKSLSDDLGYLFKMAVYDRLKSNITKNVRKSLNDIVHITAFIKDCIDEKTYPFLIFYMKQEQVSIKFNQQLIKDAFAHDNDHKNDALILASDIVSSIKYLLNYLELHAELLGY